MKEVWKPVPIKEFENSHSVSNLGRVKSNKRLIHNSKFKTKYTTQMNEKILVGNLRQGYCDVKLNNKKTFRVHRLVALAFIPNPDNKCCVNHKDGNKLNNNVSNLEWVTNQENMTHAKENNLLSKGKNHYRAKSIIQLDLNGNFIAKYDTETEAANKTNLKQRNISTCCNNKRGRVGNYLWLFETDYDPTKKYKYEPYKKQVFEFDLNGDLLNIYKSKNEVCNKTHIPFTTLTRRINNKHIINDKIYSLTKDININEYKYYNK